MGDFRQIAQHGHRIGTVGVLRRKFGQGLRGVALHHEIKKIKHPAPVRQPQHRAHLCCAGFARTVGNRLIHQAHRVADRAFGGTGDQGKRVGR